MGLHRKYRFVFFVMCASCIGSQAHIRSFSLPKYVDKDFFGMECFYVNYVDMRYDNIPSGVIFFGQKENMRNGMAPQRRSNKEVVFYLPVIDMHLEAWKLFNQMNQRKMRNFYIKEHESHNVGSASGDVNHHTTKNRNLLIDAAQSTGR